jgi:hypothetical protein
MKMIPLSIPITARFAVATALLVGLAACSSATGGGGSSDHGTDPSASGASSGSAAPKVPDVTLAPCPDALTAYFAQNKGTPIDASTIAAYTDGQLKLMPSCAFSTIDLTGDPFYEVYYITDATDAVIGYFNDAFAVAGYASQVGDSTESGTWDVGDSVFSAELTTEPDDANPPSGIIGTTYVDVFIG